MEKETRPTSRINYSSEVEQEITDLIRQHWGVSRTYTYLSTLCQAETRLRGFCHYFRLCAKRCLRNADRLMRFQIVRGGKVDLNEVKPITRLLTNGQVGLYKFLSIALEMEKRIEQWVRELHDLAETKCDVLTTEFVELHCLCDQMQMIKMLVHHLRLIRSYPYGWVYDNDPTVKEMISELMDVIRATPERACLPETLMRIPTGGPLLSVLKTI